MTTIFEKPSKKSREKTLEYIYGECLEGIGLRIPNKARAVVDHTLTPKVGDIVICRKHADCLDRYCKQVKSIGETVVVGTAYLDKSRDFEFEAEAICGVVTMVFDELFNSLVWERSDNERVVS